MNFSRALHPDDYHLFTGHKDVLLMIDKLKADFRYEHEHRKWEYGLALDFTKSLGKDIQTVADVGGGGSIMSPLLAYNKYSVTQIDAGFGENETAKQNAVLGTDMKFILSDFSKKQEDLEMFDVVISVSTIEHVPDHIAFFKNLLKHAKKAVFLTTDFSEKAEVFSPAHLRTYNGETLKEYIEIAKEYGFSPPEEPEHVYRGNYVYSYTFGSLCFLKKELSSEM